MAFEIELKAWVEDMEGIRARLSSIGQLIRTFEKSDTYFVAPVPLSDAEDGQAQEFRLRGDDGRWIVTFKSKSIKDGVEINEEQEFGVTDPGAFRQLMSRLGCNVSVYKHKSGLEYAVGRVKAELVEIRHVGAFVELERLVDELTPHSAREAEAEIRAVLHRVHVPPERIEPRPYTRMIREALEKAGRDPASDAG